MPEDLLAALALLLVLEGIMPFLSPAAIRRLWREMAHMSDRSLRLAGLVSMIAGLLMLMRVKRG